MTRTQTTAGRTWAAFLLVFILIVAIGLGAYFVGKSASHKSAESAQEATLYTCPMHPQIVRPEPGNCPICGMNLVPLEGKPAQPDQAPSGPPGQTAIHIDPARQQLIGVATEPVQPRRLHRTLRTVGIVTADESRQSEINVKVDGWIERLYADETGKIVRRGDPLLAIYSPDLVSAQEEYLVALKARNQLSSSPFAEVQKSGETLLEAARTRLRFWDISADEIAQLENSGKIRKTLTLYSPAGGYVMEKMAVEGMRVMPGMTLLRLADLSRVWVEADIYEYEAPLVAVGDAARLTLASQPGKSLQGHITYIYPTVEEMSRTLKARLEFPNPNLILKPGAFANIEIMGAETESLAVPESAVIDTGVRKVVFVKQDAGTFLPREVSLGPRAEGFYPVIEGLQPLEEVVTGANFLIDSESRFQAALQSMSAPTQPTAPAAHSH